MKKLTLLLFVCALSGCGFHLKGAQAFDKLPAQNWYVEGGQLQQPLEEALRYASGNPVKASKTDYVLRVTEYSIGRDIYTITRGAKLNEYLFTVHARAQAYKQGKAWGKPLTADLQRTMPYSDGSALGKAEEEQTVWHEMREDVAAQLVRQLGFLETSPAATE